jgi:transposase
LARGGKKAIAEGRTRLFVDESGFRPLPAVVRTWAPRGQTPLLREWLTWDHLAAISAITPSGELYLQLQDHAFKAPDVVRFLQHLLDQVPGKLLVVWDGLPIHRSRAVKDFLVAGAGQRLWLMQLPSDAPELNPDEGIWSYLKHVELANLICHDLTHLRSELEQAVERLKHKPEVIRGCVKEPGCYAV